MCRFAVITVLFSEQGHHSALVGLFDKAAHLVGLEGLDEGLNGLVVLVAFLHAQDVGPFFFFFFFFFFFSFFETGFLCIALAVLELTL